MPAPRKSSSRKRLTGNRSRTRITPEPTVPFRPPTPPKDLPKEARRHWKLLAPDLIKARKLNQFTVSLFKEYTIIMMTLEDLDRAIYETNRSLIEITSVVDSAGRERFESKETALSKTRRQHWIILERIAKSFGFTAIQFEGHYRYDTDDDNGDDF